MEVDSDVFDLFVRKYPEFPSREITWLIPSPAGGDYDARARALAPLVQESPPAKVPTVIQNIGDPEEAGDFSLAENYAKYSRRFAECLEGVEQVGKSPWLSWQII